MTQKEFDVLIFIGRFQPFHHGHYRVLKQALELAEQVIVLIGSSYKPRTIKDPWTFDERALMIEKCFPEASGNQNVLDKLITLPISDSVYNDAAWVEQVQLRVGGWISFTGKDPKDVKMGIIGHTKDRTSFYLKYFPQWEQVEVGNSAGLSATEIREYYFKGMFNMLEAGVPKVLQGYLSEFRESVHFKLLWEEWLAINHYKEQFKAMPFPPTFITTDVTVVQSGHVLLIKRKGFPGKGLYALPGGFLNIHQSLIDSALRELREETGLSVTKDHVVECKVFDHPDRSLRGRTVTHNFLIELPEGPLAEVKGSDDAASAEWIPISQVKRMNESLFEDHLDMILYFLGRM